MHACKGAKLSKLRNPVKRTLLATILGLAASVASTHGQILFYFDTYQATLAPLAGQVIWTSNVLLAPAGEAGEPVTTADGVKADLLWKIGATTGDTGLAIPTSTLYGSLSSGWIQDVNPVSIDPSYVAFTSITLTIEVWQGASYATGTATGSETWVEPGKFIGAPPTVFENIPELPIIISLLPEPTTLTLAGLCAAGLFMFRKRE